MFLTTMRLLFHIFNLAILGICMVLGIVGGLLYFLLWFFIGFPVISVLFGSLVAGYIFSSLLFFTPFGKV